MTSISSAARIFQFDTGTVTIAGECWAGNDAVAAVVLLHGGGQTRHSWKQTAQRLVAVGRTAIALDARGHGDSGWAPNQDYSIDAFTGDLLAFVETLDRPPVLVGASLGGITALLVAGEHPDLVEGLALVDVVVEIEPEGVERIQAFMTAQPDGFESLEEVANAIAAYNPLRKRSGNLDGLRKNVRQGEDGRWRWHWDPAFMRIGDEPQRRADPEQLAAAAAHVAVPTLIARGGKSDLVSEAGLADMARRIPHADVANIPAAGHMVVGDDNAVFADALEEFLERLD